MGIVWAASGSVAGAVAGFFAARHLSSGLDDLGRLGPVAAQVERGGWRAVAMLRLIPVMPHSVANYGLGLTKLPLGSYALRVAPRTAAHDDCLCRSRGGRERLMVGGASWVEPTLIGLAALSLSLLSSGNCRRRAR